MDLDEHTTARDTEAEFSEGSGDEIDPSDERMPEGADPVLWDAWLKTALGYLSGQINTRFRSRGNLVSEPILQARRVKNEGVTDGLFDATSKQKDK
ncbi:hypothetical protein FRC06_007690 [Ceratobasidium sp. 370]|nr:hypothetical protein FRC06_007690 [Ceratobasidium sp. 370]